MSWGQRPLGWMGGWSGSPVPSGVPPGAERVDFSCTRPRGSQWRLLRPALGRMCFKDRVQLLPHQRPSLPPSPFPVASDSSSWFMPGLFAATSVSSAGFLLPVLRVVPRVALLLPLHAS